MKRHNIFINKKIKKLSLPIKIKCCNFLTYQVSNALPPAANLKMIDLWMFGHTLLLTVQFLGHVIIKQVEQWETNGGGASTVSPSKKSKLHKV